MTQSEVGKYCKFLRENSGLTQVALADMLDLPKHRIAALESGKVRIREYEIKSYSQLFDVPQSQFTMHTQKQVIEENRYVLANIMRQLKAERGNKCFPVNDICDKTGIGRKRWSNITSRKDCCATEQEVELIAGYFGKDKEFFMTEPKVVKLVKEKRVDISENEKKEEESTVTLNIKDTKAEPAIVNKANDTDIWRDKAHELHRQLGEARREIERLKNEGTEKSQEHTTFDFETLSADHKKLIDEYNSCQNELEELRSNNKELGRRVENLAIENANLAEENDNLLKDYEASQNDNKELINRIEEIAKERDEAIDVKKRVVNANAELKMQCNNYREIVDSLLSEDNDDLQARYDALKAECDKYKELILKVVVKAAELLLEKA